VVLASNVKSDKNNKIYNICAIDARIVSIEIFSNMLTNVLRNKCAE